MSEFGNAFLESEWFRGFVAGAFATVFGFLLTVLWEVIKSNRDSKQKDKAILLAIEQDLIAGAELATRNIKLLNQELVGLETGLTLTIALERFYSGFWDLVKVNVPKQILNSENGLRNLRGIAAFMSEANATIDSREQYKITNYNVHNYHERLKDYNTKLVGGLMLLIDDIDTALKCIMK